MRTQTFLALVLAMLMTPALALASPHGQEPAAVQKSTINLNTATLDQLMTLPGIGQKTAERSSSTAPRAAASRRSKN